MTALDVSLEQITKDTLALKPMRVLLWILAAPFILLGMIWRVVVIIPMFVLSSAKQGYSATDKRLKQMEAQAREQAARGG